MATKRAEARYKRRREKREQNKINFYNSMPSYDEVFSYENLYAAFKKCAEGVLWKSSVQSYQINLPTNIAKLHKELIDRNWESKGFTEFDICERGKMRHIQSVHISERVLQRAFCDYYLTKLLTRNLIYDNGASMKGKGTDFTINRLKKHLRDYYNQYQTNNGYILMYDFSDYFGSISHEKLFELTDPMMLDEDLKKLFHQLINAFGDDKGIGLGSQVCQISAILFANKLDHLFKDKLKIHGYARYMDDGYAILHTKDEIKECIKYLYDCCEELGLQVNPRKIRVCKINRTFTFLKKRIFLTETGQVVVRLNRKALKASRKRLYKMKEKYEEGKLTFKEVENSFKSHIFSIKHYKNYKAIQSVIDLYNQLFIESFRKGEQYA